jgi:hypothetical protein
MQVLTNKVKIENVHLANKQLVVDEIYGRLAVVTKQINDFNKAHDYLAGVKATAREKLTFKGYLASWDVIKAELDQARAIRDGCM